MLFLALRVLLFVFRVIDVASMSVYVCDWIGLDMVITPSTTANAFVLQGHYEPINNALLCTMPIILSITKPAPYTWDLDSRWDLDYLCLRVRISVSIYTICPAYIYHA